MSKDFQNGKIYCVRNNITDDIYIGSTCQPLSKRMSFHRNSSRSESKQHYMVYRKMNELGSDKFYIELIEEYPCENNEQLRAREGHFIREMATLNSRVEGRNKKGLYQDKKAEIKERVKTYAEANKDKINNYQKEYREQNKEAISHQKKEYYEQHKENRAEYNKQYREKIKTEYHNREKNTENKTEKRCYSRKKNIVKESEKKSTNDKGNFINNDNKQGKIKINNSSLN